MRDNKKWTRTYETNLGLVTMLLTPAPDPAKKLRPNYHCFLSNDKATKLISELQQVSKTNAIARKLQCHIPDITARLYGYRVGLFFLGFAPNYTGDPNKGVTAEEWNEITERIEALFNQYAPDIVSYCEPWCADRKFQFRIELGIQTVK